MLAPGEDAIAKGCGVGGCNAGEGFTSIASSVSIGADLRCYTSLKIDAFGEMDASMADDEASWSMMEVVEGCMTAGVPGALGPVAGADLTLRRQIKILSSQKEVKQICFTNNDSEAKSF